MININNGDMNIKWGYSIVWFIHSLCSVKSIVFCSSHRKVSTSNFPWNSPQCSFVCTVLQTNIILYSRCKNTKSIINKIESRITCSRVGQRPFCLSCNKWILCDCTFYVNASTHIHMWMDWNCSLWTRSFRNTRGCVLLCKNKHSCAKTLEFWTNSIITLWHASTKRHFIRVSLARMPDTHTVYFIVFFCIFYFICVDLCSCKMCRQFVRRCSHRSLILILLVAYIRIIRHQQHALESNTTILRY